MPSTFTWLDYSSQEREQVLNVVKQLNEPESRDEIGIGTIRDRIAELLFPGTSTIHTRIRYFLFVPWIYEKLEKSTKFGSDAETYVRELEEALIKTLLARDDTDGVIGRRAKTKVKRMPSSVYWSGLYVWGIRRYNEAQSEYYIRLKHYNHRRSAQSSAIPDESTLLEDYSYWENLPPMPTNFPWNREINIRLLKHEADFLISQITNAPLTRDSLFAYLIRKGYDPTSKVDFAWHLPESIVNNLPESIMHILLTAQHFSEAIQGARFLYNLMLAQKSNNPELETIYQDVMFEWAVYITSKQRWNNLQTWSQNRDLAFWGIIGRFEIPLRTQNFVNQWLDLVFANRENLYQLAESVEARQLISERERVLKQRKARLHNRAALELWSGASGVELLDFRWRIAQNYMTELHQAMAEG